MPPMRGIKIHLERVPALDWRHKSKAQELQVMRPPLYNQKTGEHMRLITSQVQFDLRRMRELRVLQDNIQKEITSLQMAKVKNTCELAWERFLLARIQRQLSESEQELLRSELGCTPLSMVEPPNAIYKYYL